MTQRSSDREAIEAEIDRIRSLGLEDLRTLWRTTFRSSPPKGFTKDLVARFICWGGLDPQTAKVLDGYARNNKPPDRRLKAGTGRVASLAEIAEREGLGERHVRLLAPLAFVAPRVVGAIADGSAPADLTVTTLAKALPYLWVQQEQSFAATRPPRS